MNGLVVCVEFDDRLKVTLPVNRHHFERLLVVTTEADRATIRVAKHHDAQIHTTDAFYRRDGDWFNKGLAVEEGLDVLGRSGWVLIHDADILLPQKFASPFLVPGYLYWAPRRIVEEDVSKVIRPDDWSNLPVWPDTEFGGYFHLFNMDDMGPPPWYTTNWRHAGGYDSDFLEKWPKDRQVKLPFEVLHLGRPCQDWWGRCTDRLDGRPVKDARWRRNKMQEMRKLRVKHGYKKERLP